jgi:hypothetical protein
MANQAVELRESAKRCATLAATAADEAIRLELEALARRFTAMAERIETVGQRPGTLSDDTIRDLAATLEKAANKPRPPL